MSRSSIKKCLRNIIDPELGVNIVDLGLIWAVDLDQGKVEIKMILTSPGCPYGELIVKNIKKSVGKLPGVAGVKVEVLRDKLWTAEMASEEVRTELGLD